MAEKVSYCDSCQKGTEYDEIKNRINNLTTCLVNNEFITSDFYTKSYYLLKEIRDFGQDDSDPKLPNVDNFFTLQLTNLSNELITHNFYDNIINCINNNNNSNIKDNIIYGSYWTSLKELLQNIDIPTTKYFEKTCCCEGDCPSVGWYCGCAGSVGSFGGCNPYDPGL